MTDIRVAKHASSGSGHWYDPASRKQIAEVPVKSRPGDMRAPNLRDARTNGWVPGVTTFVDIAAKPALEAWKVKQAVLSSLTLPRLPEEDDDAYVERILVDAKEQSVKAAEAGTAIHAAVQAFYQREPYDPRYEQHVCGVRAALDFCCGEQRWVAEEVVAHPLGFATKADLYSALWLIDWKTRDGDESKLRADQLYPSHWMQLAATAYAIKATHGVLPQHYAIGFISRTHPGVCVLACVTPYRLERGWQMFQALHRFWTVDRDYYPGTLQ